MASLQLALAPRNGVGVQTCDLRERGDPATALLLGEEADEQAAHPFVGGSDEAVDAPMLPGAGTLGESLASGTGANVDGTLERLLGHRT